MATMIDAEKLKKAIRDDPEIPGKMYARMKMHINEATVVDAVEVELFNALKSLVNGEWVDCKLVQEALGIDFGAGLKMFDFSRTAEWNPAPLNGQKITTKFKLKNAVVHGRWFSLTDCSNAGVYCSVCNKKVWKEDYAWCNRKNKLRSNYCPNCGAKMDGDGNG